MGPRAAAPPPSRGDPEVQCAALARAQAPLRRALARIAGRLVAARAWERLGFARLSDYARERAGCSARQLQDLAHVDERLGDLPRIEAAFVAGRLTWTQARLLARVATRADEGAWLAAALGLTARGLAREVRAVDARAVEAGGAPAAGEGDPEEEPRENVRLACTPAARAKWFRAQQLARRVAGEALPRWACAEAIAAEVLSAIPLEVEVGERPPDLRRAHRSTAETANGCAGQGISQGAPAEAAGSALPAPPFLAALTDGLEEADAFALDARLRRAGRLAQRLEAQMGPLLLAVAEGRLYRRLGFANLDHYARELLGMAPRKAQALLRLERAGRLCPPLCAAYRAGRVSWVQAQALVPLLLLPESRPWRRAWVAHAGRVSVRRLEDDVDRALAVYAQDPEALAPCADPQTGARATDSEGSVPSRAGRVRLFFTAPRPVARLFRAALATVQRRIERERASPASPGEALDAMLEHAFSVWAPRHGRVPRAHRVFERDGWRCTAPGCSSYRNLHDHHIRFRSAGGSDALHNRTTLCAWHHLRGVHGGIVALSGRAPGGLRFALGLRRGAPPLAVYRGDVVARA